ncbi:ATP-binding protein [Paenibacillus agricola]|uniref:ATP-binding protein n=1 Tax=Paenibacillus agricola TaxID=2716264 RepID=UPI002892A183|nr:ATP-binding protein [Paenibacillus agricola]
MQKVDKARTRGEGGTGLGLSIVQRILDLHQMGYGAANVEGGVTFWFELPLVSAFNELKD